MSNVLQRYRNPDCRECKLHSTADYVCLLGNGRVPNAVMAIGEAPGAREDDSGKPFVGQSGQKLEKLAEAAGWDIRNEWFITNAVHCRPPDNRKPSKGEIKACGQWLRLEVDFVKPKWAILLGATAVAATLGKGYKLSDIRGQVVEHEGIKYFSTFHPSFVLRDPRKEPVMLADLRKFRGLVDGLTDEGKLPGFKPVYVTDQRAFDRMKEALRSERWTASDLETTGLDQFPRPDADKPFGVVTLGLTAHGSQYIVPLYHPEVNGQRFKPAHDIVHELDPIVRDLCLVGHNWKFDSLWLRRVYGVRWYADFDTMIAAHILDENRSVSLKSLAMENFDAMDYSLDFKKRSPYMYPLKQVMKYHALDIYYTGEHYKLFSEQLAGDSGLRKVFKYISMPLQRMLIDAEWKGVWVDKLKASRTLRDLERVVKECDTELERAFPGTNWNSPQQVADILFEKLKYTPVEMTEGGAASVSESVLLRLAKQKKPKGLNFDLIGTILKRREHSKNANDFVGKWIEMADEKDRIHPNFKITGTVTGRLSCDNPNLQQTPRNPIIRQILGAPPGRVFISADLSQIELRIVAHIANVMQMKLAFASGTDVHWRTLLKSISRDLSQYDEPINRTITGVLEGLGLPPNEHGEEAFLDVWESTKRSPGIVKKRKEGGFELAVEPTKEYARVKRDKPRSNAGYSSPVDMLAAIGPSIACDIVADWKELRKKAKAVGFGYVYGMWWKNFVVYARDNYGIDVTDEEAQTNREDFFELYPELTEYHKRQRNFARNNGYVRSLTGRKRRLPAAQYDIHSPDKFIQAKRKDAERQAINSPIQGFASELNVMIALEVTRHFAKTKSKVYAGESIVQVIGLVHDETLFECDADAAEDVCRFIRKTAEWPPILSKFISKLSVPLEGSISIGQWGIGKEWK